MILFLTDQDSGSSRHTFHFALMNNNLKIGIQEYEEDVYLGMSTAIKKWNSNAKTWSLENDVSFDLR